MAASHGWPVRCPPHASLSVVCGVISWSGRSGWLSANRSEWLMEGKGAGWVQQSGLLTQVVVQGAGTKAHTQPPTIHTHRHDSIARSLLLCVCDVLV